MELQDYYNEHAAQARQHENQRAIMSSMVLGVAGALVTIITYLELSLWTLPASITLCVLGVYGFLFSGKHYERNRYHVEILKSIRDEMDARELNPDGVKRTLAEIRSAGVKEHYKSFEWPKFKSTKSGSRASAKSWISRQHLHVFWEMIHLIFLGMGVVLIFSTFANALQVQDIPPTEIRIVQ